MSNSSSDEDSCSRQWKRANLNLRSMKRATYRLEQQLAKKQHVIKELQEDLHHKVKHISRLEKDHHQLSQLIVAERNHFNREKENYFSEMVKMKRELGGAMATPACTNRAPFLFCRSNPEYHQQSTDLAALQAENKKLRSLVEAADEQNESLCHRFLRMKAKKDELFAKCLEIEDDFLKSLSNAMRRFDELRSEVNTIMDRITRCNHDLAYENSFLRLELQCLRKKKIALYSSDRSRSRKCKDLLCQNGGGSMIVRRASI